MDKEAIFKKIKFSIAGESLIVNAPEEYLSILAGTEFDTLPEDVKLLLMKNGAPFVAGIQS